MAEDLSPGGLPMPSEEEAKRIESRCFERLPGSGVSLVHWPKKLKERLVLLRRIAGLFDEGKAYTEKDINAVLENVWADHVMIRRCLIDFKYLERKPDGSEYWRPSSP